jgi:hypothetical protein
MKVSANPNIEFLDRRKKPPVAPVFDPTKRIVLPENYYVDSLLPTVRLPAMQPTRIDFLLEPAVMPVLDFLIPDEPDIWAAWAIARVKREAADAEHSGFSECITMEGSSANIRMVSHKTRRVMEQRDLLFRFAIDHSIDVPDPALPREPAPIRVVVVNTLVDKIRADNADARSRGVNQRPRKPSKPAKRRSQIPWSYVAGLGSALALLASAHFLHLT